MEFQANYPIYLQITEDIKRRIVIGELKPGDKLPSNVDLAMEYQVNPNTVQRIYHQLEDEGISYSKRGVGTFLRDDSTLPTRLQQQIGITLCNKFLAQMQTYDFTETEIMHLIQSQMQKEDSTC